MAENGYLIISLSSCCKTLERKKKVHLKRINLPNLSLSTPLLQLPKFLDLHWPAVVSVALEVDVNNGGRKGKTFDFLFDNRFLCDIDFDLVLPAFARSNTREQVAFFAIFGFFSGPRNYTRGQIETQQFLFWGEVSGQADRRPPILAWTWPTF